MAGWFIWWNSEAVGPIDSKRLARLVGNGDIGADDWLWHHEIGEWRQVRTLGLLPPAASATPADSDVWPYGASETRRRSAPDNGGSAVEMPSPVRACSARSFSSSVSAAAAASAALKSV